MWFCCVLCWGSYWEISWGEWRSVFNLWIVRLTLGATQKIQDSFIFFFSHLFSSAFMEILCFHATVFFARKCKVDFGFRSISGIQWSLKKLTVSTGQKLSRESVTLSFMHTGQNLQMIPIGSALLTWANARLYKLLSEINGAIVGYTQGDLTQWV